MDNDILCERAVNNEKHLKSLISQLEKSSTEQNSIIKSFKEVNRKQQILLGEKDSKISELQTDLFKFKNKEASKSHKDKDGFESCQTCKEKERQLLDAHNTIQLVQIRNRELENANNQYVQELEATKVQLERSQKANYKLEQNISKCERENEEMRKQIDDWVKRKHSSVSVQMYAAVNRELCEKMMNELEDMLRTQLEMYDTIIEVDKYKDPPPDCHLPLLVLCINASRLGTDVTQALNKVNRSRTVAVIVLHHKEIHALPRQPSEKLLIGKDYKDINLIVDIAYLTTKGIYPCEMNNRSMDRLFNFIKSNCKV